MEPTLIWILVSVLGGFVLVVLALYLGVLYDTQVNDHEDYLAQSIRTITQPETVLASHSPLRANRSYKSVRSAPAAIR